jgi:hypothetical protein
LLLSIERIDIDLSFVHFGYLLKYRVKLVAPLAPTGVEINEARLVANVFPTRLLACGEVVITDFLLEVFGR